MRCSELTESIFYTDPDDIEPILDEYDIKGWTILPGGIVDIKGSVDLFDRELTHLPVRFGVVTGNFDCARNELTTLEGAPTHARHFSCANNKLKSLEFMPSNVLIDVNAYGNPLTSFVGIADFCKSIGTSGNGRLALGQLKDLDFVDGGLGLLLIENLTVLDWASEHLNDPLNIIARHIKTKDVFACQQELIKHGHEHNAIL